MFRKFRRTGNVDGGVHCRMGTLGRYKVSIRAYCLGRRGKRGYQVVSGRALQSCNDKVGKGLQGEFRLRDVMGCVLRRGVQLICVHSCRGTGPFAVDVIGRLGQRKIGIIVRVPACPCSRRCVAHEVGLSLLISQYFHEGLTTRLSNVIAFSSTRAVFKKRAVHVSGKVSFSTVPRGVAQGSASQRLRLVNITRMRC